MKPWADLSRRRARPSPIGLDLGGHSIKAVQVSDTDRRSLSLPRRSTAGPLTADDVRRATDVLDRRGFVGREVVVAVPPAALLTAVLDLPARAAGVPVDQIAAAEFARVHRADVAAVTMSTWDLPPSARSGRGTHALAVGAKSADLDAHLDLVESAGLNVVAVQDPHSAAVRGCLAADAAVADGMSAVLDLGWSAASLAVSLGGTVVYTRRLGEAQVQSVVTRAVAGADGDADPDEVTAALWAQGFGAEGTADRRQADAATAFEPYVADVLGEVSRALDYVGGLYPSAPLGRVVLVGGAATVRGMAWRCFAHLAVQAEPATDAGLVTALGLALFAGDDH